MSSEKYAALRANSDQNGWLFWGNEEPLCPHCGESCPANENEWWKLYEEGEHEVTCPHCDEDFTVKTNISYTFSTDEQEAPNEQ